MKASLKVLMVITGILLGLGSADLIFPLFTNYTRLLPIQADIGILFAGAILLILGHVLERKNKKIQNLAEHLNQLEP